MPLTRNPLRTRRRLALLVLVVGLAGSAALGALFVAKKRADAEFPGWPAGPQPLRIDVPRDARIAGLRTPDVVEPPPRDATVR